MSDTMSLGEVLSDGLESLKQLLGLQQQDLVTILRQPSPIKVTKVVTADASGNIGGTIAAPNPVMLFQIPMSHEGWINRVTASSPGHGPGAPLTAGEVWVTTNTGVPIFFLPIGGSVAPVIISEGRISAPHLSAGEQVVLSADGLGAGTVLRLDFQIVLVTGVSGDTPLNKHEKRPVIVEQ